MKKNNYYVGLLAGVLTAGVLQGSDGKENMPGLGDNPTSIVQGQASGITEELKVAASELAASYDERAEGSQNQAIRGLFRARANHLRATFGIANATESIEPDENDSLYIEKTRYNYAKKLANYYKLKGNEEFARDLKNDFAYLDYYTAFLASQKFENNDNFRNYQISKTRLGYTTFINNAPMRNESDAKLYPTLRTQQIFGSEDYIVPGMYQYVIAYPVTKAEIEAWVDRLRNMHNDEALKERRKPIIFQAQKFETRTMTPVTENKDFEIKSYWCNINTGDNMLSASTYYNKLKSYNKPIVFGKTERDLKFSTGVKASYFKQEVSYQEYLELVNQYGDNFFVGFVHLKPNSMQELQQQLGALIKSKNVNQIRIDHETYVDVANIPLEYLGCIKIRNMSFSNYQNPNGELFLIRTMLGNINNVNCKTIYCFDSPYPEQNTSVNRVYERMKGNALELNSQRIVYVDKLPEDINERLREMEKAYLQYIKHHELEYLSGYVNIENKPSELSDNEWRKVIILKGKAEEIKMLMCYDQVPKEKFFIVKNTINEIIEAGIALSRLNEANIAYELETRGLQIQNVTGDGNCGIYALLAGLNPDQASNYEHVSPSTEEGSPWQNAANLRQALFGNTNALGQMVTDVAAHNQVNRWLALDNQQALQAVNTHVRNQGRSSLVILDTTVTVESGVAFTVIGANGEQIRYNTLTDALNEAGNNPLMLVYTPNHWKAVVPKINN